MPLLSLQPASRIALPTAADPLTYHHKHQCHPELGVGRGGRKDWGEGAEGGERRKRERERKGEREQKKGEEWRKGDGERKWRDGEREWRKGEGVEEGGEK